MSASLASGRVVTRVVLTAPYKKSNDTSLHRTSISAVTVNVSPATTQYLPLSSLAFSQRAAISDCAYR